MSFKMEESEGGGERKSHQSSKARLNHGSEEVEM